MATFVLLLSVFSQVPSASADRAPLTEAVQTAILANRAVLSYGTIHFTYTVGNAKDAEAAGRGELQDKWVAEGLYIYDGHRARYECIFAAADMLAERTDLGSGSSETLLMSDRFLTDGKVSLFDILHPSGAKGIPSPAGKDLSLYSHTSQINPGTDTFFNSVLIPIGLGDPNYKDNLTGQFEAAKTGQEGWKLIDVDEHAKWEGFDVALLTFECPGGKSKSWVDLERGAITRLRQSIPKARGPSGEDRYGDIRQVAGKGWVPFSWTIFVEGGFAKQLVIQEADFVKRPDPSLFQMEYPAPTPMINTANYTRYEPRKVWNLAELPSPTAPGVRRIPPSAPSSSPNPPLMPVESEPIAVWAIVCLVFGMIIVLASVTYWRRRHAGSILTEPRVAT